MEVKVTVGSREHREDGSIRYVSGNTEEGYCYKDYEAWENGGICYIPEAEFNFDAYREAGPHRPRFGTTKVRILEDVREMLEYYPTIPKCTEFEEHLARSVFEIASWECIATILDRIDYEEEWLSFNENR